MSWRSALWSYSISWSDQNLSTRFLAHVNSRSRSLYAVARPPVCRLSVVCNARAPYSAGWNFRQCFYAIWYLDHLSHPRKLLRISSQGNPSVGGVKRKRVAKYSDFRPMEDNISETMRDRKSCMSLRLVPKSVILNDFERRNGPCFELFHRIP